MRRLRLSALLVVLFVGACTGGVSQEVHDEALEDARLANERIGELETALSAAEDQLSDTQDGLSEAEADKADAEGRAASLEDELAEASEVAAAAEARLGELADLTQMTEAPGSTLARVLATGALPCGVGGTQPGFSMAEPDRSIAGFDADFCRAIAAAVLGDAGAVRFVTLNPGQRFEALRNGVVDVLIRTTTWTLGRDAVLGEGVDFGPTIFYDGQQLMASTDVVGTAPGAANVDGTRLCAVPGRFSFDTALAWVEAQGATVDVVGVGSIGQALEYFQVGSCDLVTTDGSALAGWRDSFVEDGSFGPQELLIFPETPLSREPLSPVYRQGDTVWADIVDWVVYATMIAEEKDITSTNIDTIEWDAEATRLFGADDDSLAVMLGLDSDAFYQVIKQVGNYGEIFDRNLGPLRLTRPGTPNARHTEGGLIYAPPVR
jgi:general L-amino acid transport system substrate-binding protein